MCVIRYCDSVNLFAHFSHWNGRADSSACTDRICLCISFGRPSTFPQIGHAVFARDGGAGFAHSAGSAPREDGGVRPGPEVGAGLGSDLSAEAGSGVAELVKILDCRSVRRDELLPDAGVSTIAGAGLRLADGFRLVDNVVRFKCVFSGGTIRSSIAQYGSVWLNSSNPFRNSSASSESFSISHAHGFLPFSISANTGETPAPSP
mmetsp:Transcript_2120/g.5680  ORF Transcript_2120/g.5680 Transcript_2120/m.5680 type:complete len:205 (-) Transcript_2120:101-715(-)